MKIYLLSIILLMISCQKKDKFLNIGHRGAMGHVMENTLPSVQKALDLKVDMIEIDVFICKTGELVVFHDDLLDNLSSSTGKIEDLTLEEIKKVKLNGNFNIPTLEEVIDLVQKKVPLNIELKGKNTAKPTFELLKKYYQKGYKYENFVISSFLWNELEIYQKLDNNISIAVLTEENPLNAIPFAKKINAKAINPWFKNLTKNQVIEIKKEGFKIYTYTVNEKDDIIKIKSWGVDGVFTNFPEKVLESY
jgi:glycerophosphoryl diester phosphodiesterase